MYDNQLTIRDRLEDILESINLIQEWSKNRTTVSDFMSSSTGVMAFNACVMRFQVIFVTYGVFNTMQAQLLSVLVAVSRNPNCCALLSSRAQSVS